MSADLSQGGATNQGVKDAVNLALDYVESAGLGLAEVCGYSSFTERLGRILADLEQWKADVWEELDA